MTDRGCLILLRHGESAWNAQHRFTGWGDPPLTDRGIVEGREAGSALADERLFPDLVASSLLSRAEQTVAAVLSALESRPDVIRDWRLNERHYGALEGMHHDVARDHYGVEAVQRWRRSWDATPPSLHARDPRRLSQLHRYSEIPTGLLPGAESLTSCLERQLPFLESLLTTAAEGAHVLLIGHGNALRALVAHLEHIAPDKVPGLLIPTGVPLLYHHATRWELQKTAFKVRGTWTGP